MSHERVFVVALVVAAMVLFIASPLIGTARRGGGPPPSASGVIGDLGQPAVIARDYSLGRVELPDGSTGQRLTLIGPASSSSGMPVYYMVYFDRAGPGRLASDFLSGQAPADTAGVAGGSGVVRGGPPEPCAGAADLC